MKFLKSINEIAVPVKGQSKDTRLQNLPHKGEEISNKGISIFEQDWFEKLLPDTITIHSIQNLKKINPNLSLTELTDKIDYVFDKNDCTINGDLIQFNYYCNNMKVGDLNNGEPDFIEFDIHFVKNTKGIKLLVDITYGDNMAYEFSIETPNKINVIHYTGKGSMYDSQTHFGFCKESVKDLVKFFNAFNHGISLTEKDLKFLDFDEDSYRHNVLDAEHLYNDKSDLIEFENSPKIESFSNFVKKL